MNTKPLVSLIAVMLVARCCIAATDDRADIAAERSANRRQATARQSDDWTRRCEPAGAGSGISRSGARDSRRGQEDACKSRDGRGERGGNRVTAYSATRQATGSAGRAKE